MSQETLQPLEDYIFIVDREDYVAAVHDDKEEIDIVVDSGAAASCVNKDLLPDVPVKKAEQRYNLKAAHGTKIEHYGHKDVRLIAEDGNGDDAHVTSRYQATNVKKTIKSVYETSQHGNLAIFYDDGGEFVHVGPQNMQKARELIHQLFPGHRRIPFGIKNRQYVLKGYVDNSENAEYGISPVDFKEFPDPREPAEQDDKMSDEPD